MKRKLVQHGASLITSLPRKWTQKYGLKRGDEVDVEERGPVLEISTKKAIAFAPYQLDITDMDKSLVWRYILALYRFGVDEITITHKNQMDLIQSIGDVLIGFGIVQHETNKAVLKDLSGVSESEFENIYRRCHLLLLEISNRTLELWKSKKSLTPILAMDKNLNKYVDYCLRMLSKRGYKDPKKTPLYYHNITQLEYIGDLFTRIAKFNPKELKYLDEINSLLRTFYELSFKFDNSKAVEIMKKRKMIETKIKNTDLREILHTIINLLEMQFALSI